MKPERLSGIERVTQRLLRRLPPPKRAVALRDGRFYPVWPRNPDARRACWHFRRRSRP